MEKENRERKKLWPLVAAFFVLLLAFILLLRCCVEETEVVKLRNSDAIIEGPLTNDSTEMDGNADTFRVRLNAMPVLTKGKLNLRIENPMENRYTCQVEVMVQRYSRLSADGEKLMVKRGEQAYEVLRYTDTQSYRLRPISDSEGYTEVTLADGSATQQPTKFKRRCV